MALWTMVNRTFQWQVSSAWNCGPDVIPTSGLPDKERPGLPRAQLPHEGPGHVLSTVLSVALVSVLTPLLARCTPHPKLPCSNGKIRKLFFSSYTQVLALACGMAFIYNPIEDKVGASARS